MKKATFEMTFNTLTIRVTGEKESDSVSVSVRDKFGEGTQVDSTAKGEDLAELYAQIGDLLDYMGVK